ncbi:MAG: hypothetical protein FWF57_05170 [Defluviitaleaceae bacterium]|nr:hypothetical protein [Defluviitaleaceae bacterium]
MENSTTRSYKTIFKIFSVLIFVLFSNTNIFANTVVNITTNIDTQARQILDGTHPDVAGLPANHSITINLGAAWSTNQTINANEFFENVTIQGAAISSTIPNAAANANTNLLVVNRNLTLYSNITRGATNGNDTGGHTILVNPTGNLTTHGSVAGHHTTIRVDGGTLTINSGTISHDNNGNNTNHNRTGRAIAVQNGGTININGGFIQYRDGTTTGTRTRRGTGIEATNGSTVNMAGGSIRHTTSAIYINNSILNINGENVAIYNNRSTSGENLRAGGITVSGSNAVFNMRAGTIGAEGTRVNDVNNAANSSNNTSGGVLVRDGARFNMYGGRIVGNISQTGSQHIGGGGVAVSGNGSRFDMHGGFIHNNGRIGSAFGWDTVNTAGTDAGGGGVYVRDGARFDFVGGTISNNASRRGGGIAIDGIGSLVNMAGNALLYNNVATEGWRTTGAGGISVGHSTIFNMYGGIIRGNGASNAGSSNAIGGGGVRVQPRGTFTMYGGEILDNRVGTGVAQTAYNSTGSDVTPGNHATHHGGGVLVLEAATFTMSGGFIRGNQAGIGAGIMFTGSGTTANPAATVTITGGVITENNATATAAADGGGGIASRGISNASARNTTYTTLSIGSNAIIAGNTIGGARTQGRNNTALFNTNSQIRPGITTPNFNVNDVPNPFNNLDIRVGGTGNVSAEAPEIRVYTYLNNTLTSGSPTLLPTTFASTQTVEVNTARVTNATLSLVYNEEYIWQTTTFPSFLYVFDSFAIQPSSNRIPQGATIGTHYVTFRQPWYHISITENFRRYAINPQTVTVNAHENATTLIQTNTLQLSASVTDNFNRPFPAGEGTRVWSIALPNGTSVPEGASISDTGTLSVDHTVPAGTIIRVTYTITGEHTPPVTVSGFRDITIESIQRVPTEIILSPNNVEVYQGDTQEFTVVVKDQFGETMQTPEGIIWRVEYNQTTYSGVTIDEDGKAEVAHDATVGRTVAIIAELEYNNTTITGTANLTIKYTERIPTTIVVTPSNANVNQSSTQQYTVIVNDQFGNVMPTQTEITWSATYNNAAYSYVTIDSSGLVNVAYNATIGRVVTITATLGKGANQITGTTTLTVVETTRIPYEIIVTPNPQNIDQGDNYTFTAVIYSQFGEDITSNHTIVWTTSRPITEITTSAATSNLNSQAKVTIAENAPHGQAILYATVGTGANQVQGTAIINIQEVITTPPQDPNIPKNILISPSSLIMPLGGFAQVTAQVLNYAGDVITNPDFVITWTSDSHGPINVWYDSNFVFIETIPTETFHGQTGNITATLQGTDILATLVVTVDANINAPILPQNEYDFEEVEEESEDQNEIVENEYYLKNDEEYLIYEKNIS